MAAQAVQGRAEVKKQSQKSESYAQLMKSATRKDQNKVKNQEAHHEADAFEKHRKSNTWKFAIKSYFVWILYDIL